MVKLGKAFSDNISVFRKRRVLAQPKLTGWGARLTLLYLALCVGFFLLSVRLFHLTVVRGQENRSLSEKNRIRTSIIHAPRGIFYDRHGVSLTKNLPSFRVVAPCEQDKNCTHLFITEEEWEKSGLDRDSVFLEKDYLRSYLFAYETAHVLGYLSEITSEEFANPLFSYQDLLLGDRLGRTGLEQTLEKTLRGTNGRELIEVDAMNRKVRTLGKVDAIAGKDVTLALDVGLQKAAYQALGENPGAAIVSNPKTGEILALVSTPSFDPNKINRGIGQDEFTVLLNRSDQPFFNRAIAGVYPPGSTFKPIVAIAGLESKKISPETTIEDEGVLSVGGSTFANWYFTQYGKTEGEVDLLKGIARSNDIYFYKLGETVGVNLISDWGGKFGIGAKTGLELSGEAQGVMPDPDWRKKVRGDDWFLGDTYHISIGQGDLVATPLQVNLWTNIIASGGIKCQLTLLKQELANFTGKQGVVNKESGCEDLVIRKETIDTVTEGMRRACYRGDDIPYQGTGWPFFDFSVTRKDTSGVDSLEEKISVPIACKTGTSEFGDPEGKTHAWFTAFAPLPSTRENSDLATAIFGEPEIVVTVLIEGGGEGSSVAGPIAKKIFEEWFSR